ncbi:MAG: DUF86 domain-containing protein [Candidatus Hydrothermarchaeota archaeon]|nr:MAG: DUF86 domain-containing protein [Candidatus Hydrothermarchaeota archaeon]
MQTKTYLCPEELKNIMLSEKRLQRYKDKLNLILLRTDEAKKWLGEKDLEELIYDNKTKLAIYKAFQEIAEASMDIIAMVCKDEKFIPKDDYTNINILFERKILDKELRDILKEFNGLRNVLVHRYNGTDDLRALRSIDSLLQHVEKFVEVVEKWISKKS